MISDPEVADVQMRTPRQAYILAKKAGETSLFAVAPSGKIIYSANLRVSDNIESVGEMLKMALPESQITATPMNGILLLTGVAASPKDSQEAERLSKALVGSGVEVVNRTKTATPVQVSLQVRIAEVNRTVVRNIGVNLMSRDTTGGFLFGVAQGRPFGSIGNRDLSSYPQGDASALFKQEPGTVMLPMDPITGAFIRQPGTQYSIDDLGQGAGRTNLGIAGKLLGMDLMAAIDLAENQGLATTLAQPNLTAVSGETASFLAGGEIPIPTLAQLGQVSVEYKQYGVSLDFTPVVLSDGRISIRVRPEVSQLTAAGSVQINGFSIPALSTRRVETTVELGSGQSFMIGGLMQNGQNNTIDKAPGLGDLPILGNLFRSREFRKNQTELVVIVTPFLVKPVSANDIKLPTDGLSAAGDLEQLILGSSYSGKTGAERPMPSAAPAVTRAARSPADGGTGRFSDPARPSSRGGAERGKKRDLKSASPGFGQ
jgi:pilus assembly protein CpaC